jgi:hypothetical protein
MVERLLYSARATKKEFDWIIARVAPDRTNARKIPTQRYPNFFSAAIAPEREK